MVNLKLEYTLEGLEVKLLDRTQAALFFKNAPLHALRFEELMELEADTVVSACNGNDLAKLFLPYLTKEVARRVSDNG